MLDARFQRAANYIEEHLAEDVSIETLAGLAAMSPFHFARSFKRALSVTPGAYRAARA